MLGAAVKISAAVPTLCCSGWNPVSVWACRQFNRFNSLQGVNGFWKWMLDRLKHKDGSSVLIHHDREHPTAADFCAAFGGSKRPPVVLFIDEASALAGKVQCFQTSISVMQHAVHTIC